jgi:hypothetical protein
MANNSVMKPGWQFPVILTTPAVPTSGGPVLYGNLTGIAMGLLDATSLATVVDFGPGIWDISVTAVGGDVEIGDNLFINAAGTQVNNTAAGFFFGVALEHVGIGVTATINVMHVPSPGAGTLGAGTIATAHLANNVLSADAPGRAKMAADYFNAATVLTHFDANSFDTANLLLTHAANSITNAVLLQAVLDGAFQADADTRALFADRIWPELKIALASLTGNVAAVNATENAVGSIPVYHRFTIPDVGAPTDYSILMTHKTLITQWWIQNTGLAAHNTDDTINLKNVADSLSGAVAKTNVVNGVIRPTTMDDTHCLVTAGTNLTVTATKSTNIACIVHVLGVRSA